MRAHKLLSLALAGAVPLVACGGNVILDASASGHGPSGFGGSGTGAGGSSSGTVLSCDIHMAGTHECEEFSDVPSDDPAVVADCMAAMGAVGTGCPSAGRLGTCSVDMSGFMVTLVAYAGAGLTPFEAEQACMGAGGTWSAG